MEKYVAVIPARKGSKRLPNKNILDLNGKPLVSYTIDEALKIDEIDKIFISSDDLRVKGIVEKYNSPKLTFVNRDLKLATDKALTVDVIIDVINRFNLLDNYEYVILLQPTSPLRTSDDINGAIKMHKEKKNARAIISVCQSEHSPLWANTLPKDLNMNNFIKEEIKNKPSQDLPIYYRLNGAIYIINIKDLLHYKTLFIPKSYAYIMPPENSIDIDTIIDFKLVEFMLKRFD